MCLAKKTKSEALTTVQQLLEGGKIRVLKGQEMAPMTNSLPHSVQAAVLGDIGSLRILDIYRSGWMR